MRTVLNIIWFILAGLWLALFYAFFGVVLCLLIVTIPFGVQLFKLARFALWPFGRVAVRSPGATGFSTVGNVLWLIPGLLLAFAHLVTALLCAVTVIGIPLAYANVKLIPMALTPFGREIVRGTEVTDALGAYRAMQQAPAAPEVAPGEAAAQLEPPQQPPPSLPKD